MNLNCYGKSHVGLKRSENQDSFLLIEKEHQTLAIVCDGIGGGNAGDVASRMATAHLKDRFEKTEVVESDIEVKHWLEKVIQEANDLIFTQSTKKIEQKGMGTTLVGVLVCEQATYIFNVGDSRTYGLYEDDFLCLTEDHTYVAGLLKRGEVSEEEAMKHPNRNVLTNALGIWDNVQIDINKIQNDYQSLLVCSDGLHGYVSEDTIRFILDSKNHSTQEKVEVLVQDALDAGGYDNITVIILEKDGVQHG
ncbi:Stp1/IreP family PP2C-type Ser/Thr phosphatase [Amedibacillus sp. YH-ame10]